MAGKTKTDETREPGEHARDNIITVGVNPDTFREFEEYRVERELKPSEAARRLLRAGIENERSNSTLDAFGKGLIIAGIIGIALGAAESDILFIAASAVAAVLGGIVNEVIQP